MSYFYCNKFEANFLGLKIYGGSFWRKEALLKIFGIIRIFRTENLKLFGCNAQ